MRFEYRAAVRATPRGMHYIVIPKRDVAWLEQETHKPLKGLSIKVELEV